MCLIEIKSSDEYDNNDFKNSELYNSYEKHYRKILKIILAYIRLKKYTNFSKNMKIFDNFIKIYLKNINFYKKICTKILWFKKILHWKI